MQVYKSLESKCSEQVFEVKFCFDGVTIMTCDSCETIKSFLDIMLLFSCCHSDLFFVRMSFQLIILSIYICKQLK